MTDVTRSCQACESGTGTHGCGLTGHTEPRSAYSAASIDVESAVEHARTTPQPAPAEEREDPDAT